MNTRQELMEAVDDYQAGRFGKISIKTNSSRAQAILILQVFPKTQTTNSGYGIKNQFLDILNSRVLRTFVLQSA